MLLKKVSKFLNTGLAVIRSIKKGYIYPVIAFILLFISGCSGTFNRETEMVEDDSKIQELEQDIPEETEDISWIEEIKLVYKDIYIASAESEALGRQEVVKSIVTRLGDCGYVVVDSENQIDMVGAEQVREFCAKVDTKEKAELTIIVISYNGGLTRYDFKAENENVNIVRGYYQYENEDLKKWSEVKYSADLWQYTEEGYLLFEGNYFSEELYVLVLGDATERVALRVEPLEQKYRDLNRQYILPISYSNNNMFLIDWSEEDFEDLDFYDLYDVFYSLLNKQNNPYTAGVDAGTSAVYYIAKEEFESVITSHFNIDSKTLQSKTIYITEDEKYEYRPRGFYEIEYPDIPYPEVVYCKENGDGTITLTVNAVYPNDGTSKAYAHEVVIRLLADGHFQYVSNVRISTESDYEEWWHTDRLTKAEWEDLYRSVSY